MLSTVLEYTREKYYLLIQYQILGTKITRIVGQIVRRVFNEIRRQKPKLKTQTHSPSRIAGVFFLIVGVDLYPAVSGLRV